VLKSSIKSITKVTQQEKYKLKMKFISHFMNSFFLFTSQQWSLLTFIYCEFFLYKLILLLQTKIFNHIKHLSNNTRNRVGCSKSNLALKAISNREVHFAIFNEPILYILGGVSSSGHCVSTSKIRNYFHKGPKKMKQLELDANSIFLSTKIYWK